MALYSISRRLLSAISLFRRASTSSFSTIWPSCTSTPLRMPPSRFWMICVREEGTTCPSAWVTSSSTANPAHTIKATKKQNTPKDSQRAF